jgi:hypothetical protein
LQQQLALLPLAANNLLGSNVHINATTLVQVFLHPNDTF